MSKGLKAAMLTRMSHTERRANRPRRRSRITTAASQGAACFWTLWSFIALVSLVDAYLVYYNLEAMPSAEENPVCRFLISLDTERLSIFLPAKAAGTALVLSVLRLIFVRNRRYSLLVISGVAAYQAGLMIYAAV